MIGKLTGKFALMQYKYMVDCDQNTKWPFTVCYRACKAERDHVHTCMCSICRACVIYYVSHRCSDLSSVCTSFMKHLDAPPGVAWIFKYQAATSGESNANVGLALATMTATPGGSL